MTDERELLDCEHCVHWSCDTDYAYEVLPTLSNPAGKLRAGWVSLPKAEYLAQLCPEHAKLSG